VSPKMGTIIRRHSAGFQNHPPKKHPTKKKNNQKILKRVDNPFFRGKVHPTGLRTQTASTNLHELDFYIDAKGSWT